MSRVPFRTALVTALALGAAACSGGGGGGGNGGGSNGGGGGGGSAAPTPAERFGTCFNNVFVQIRNSKPIDIPDGCLAPPVKTADPIEIN